MTALWFHHYLLMYLFIVFQAQMQYLDLLLIYSKKLVAFCNVSAQLSIEWHLSLHVCTCKASLYLIKRVLNLSVAVLTHFGRFQKF